MVFERLQSKKDRPVEGVVDVGVIVFAHFQNPARRHVLDRERYCSGKRGVWLPPHLLLRFSYVC